MKSAEKVMKKISNISVLHKYSLSFILVFLIPCICFAVLFFQVVVNEVKSELNFMYEEKVSSISSYLENQQKNILTTSYNIANNTVLKSFLTDKNIYNEMSIIKYLQLAISQNVFVDECIYYEKNSADIYSSSGKSELSYFFEDYQNANEKFMQNLDFKKSNISSYTKKKVYDNSDSSPENVVFFSYPLLSQNPNDNEAVIIFLVSEPTINKSISSVVGNFNGAFYIMDYENQKYIPLKKYSGIDDKIFKKLLIKEETSPNEIIDNEKYHIISRKAQKSTSSYVFVSKYDEYYKLALNLNKKITIFMLVIFILCVCISFIMAYLNYKPIKALSKKMLSPSDDNDYSGDDELKKLDILMGNTIKSNIDMKKEIMEKDTVLKHDLLYSLIAGKNNKFAESQDSINFSFKYSNFFLIVCCFEFNLNDTNESKYILRNDVKKVLETVYIEGCNTFCVKLDELKYIAVLCNTDLCQQDVAEEFITVFNEKNSIYNTHIRFGIGNIYDDITKIKLSYMEAMSTFDAVNNDENVVYFDAIDNQSEIISYPTKQMMRYLQSLKQGDYSVACELIQDILSTLDKDCVSNLFKTYIISDIVNAIIKFAGNMNISININELHLLLDGPSDKLYDTLYSITEKICSTISSRELNKKSEKESELLTYVDKNYTDYDISLEKLSQLFDISSYYISKIFKDKYEVGFRNYIMNLRVEKAKKLLVNTEEKINSISEEVGYANPSHFIKIFKKSTGLTPEQYRKMD